VAARIIAVLAAGLAVAWFAIGVRQARDTDRATDIITSATPLSPARARDAQSLLRAAKQLNPDAAVDLLGAQLALRQGNRPRARSIARSVTRSEPQNIEAWLAYGAASSNDRAAFVFALRHLNALAPAVTPGR